jgi:hypothetical protein
MAMILNGLTCADIDMESCEAEKSILRRRLSESASEVERWVRILPMNFKDKFFLCICLFRDIQSYQLMSFAFFFCREENALLDAGVRSGEVLAY